MILISEQHSEHNNYEQYWPILVQQAIYKYKMAKCSKIG